MSSTVELNLSARVTIFCMVDKSVLKLPDTYKSSPNRLQYWPHIDISIHHTAYGIGI